MVCAAEYVRKECVALRRKRYDEFIVLWKRLKRDGVWKELLQLTGSFRDRL